MKKWLRIKLQEFLNMSKHIKLSTWMAQTDLQIISMEEEIERLQMRVDTLELEASSINENIDSLNTKDKHVDNTKADK